MNYLNDDKLYLINIPDLKISNIITSPREIIKTLNTWYNKYINSNELENLCEGIQIYHIDNNNRILDIRIQFRKTLNSNFIEVGWFNSNISEDSLIDIVGYVLTGLNINESVCIHFYKNYSFLYHKRLSPTIPQWEVQDKWRV